MEIQEKLSFWKIWGIFLILELESFISGNIRKYLGEKIPFPVGFLGFLRFGMDSVGFRFWKYKKDSLLRKSKESFLLREYKEFF